MSLGLLRDTTTLSKPYHVYWCLAQQSGINPIAIIDMPLDVSINTCWYHSSQSGIASCKYRLHQTAVDNRVIVKFFVIFQTFVIHKGNKQRVLMHRHQGWNVRHGLCHIYMRYLYIYELFIAFVCFVVCSLLQRDGIFGVLCRKWQARESTGMFGNLMAIYYIMPQFIQNHSRFVMLMKTCMIS